MDWANNLLKGRQRYETFKTGFHYLTYFALSLKWMDRSTTCPNHGDGSGIISDFFDPAPYFILTPYFSF